MVRDWCGPLVAPLARTRYISFSEGWALYAENPLISSDTGELRLQIAFSHGIIS